MTDCVLYQHSLDYRLLYLCIAIINTYEYTDIKLECFTWLRRKESNFRRFILFSIFTVTYSNESIMLSSYSFEVITFNAQSKLLCTGQTVKFLQMRQQWQQNIIMKKKTLTTTTTKTITKPAEYVIKVKKHYIFQVLRSMIFTDNEWKYKEKSKHGKNM